MPIQKVRALHSRRRTIRHQLILNLIKRNQENERVLATALRQLSEIQREVRDLKKNFAILDPDTKLKEYAA